MKRIFSTRIPVLMALILLLAAAVVIPSAAQPAPTWLRTPAI